METQNVEVRALINASPHDIYSALVSGDELTQWFAEYADVSLEDERYDFWGKLTPGTPAREAGRNTLLRYEKDQELKFSWTFRGKDTHVSIQLSEQGPGTMLKLVHFGLPTRKQGKFAVSDYWMLCLENLRQWVERRAASVQCDFSRIQVGGIKLAVDIDAPSNEVFKTLVDSERLDRYMGRNSDVKAEVGADYEIGWGDEGPAKILEIEQDKKLTYSWEYPDTPETVVTWTLEGSGGSTRLTLVHSGFAEYRVEDGAIVGTSVKRSPNTFLCTDQEFGDFILEFEVLLVSPELNSGVQFRSMIAKEEMIFWFRNDEGKHQPRKIPADRVYGYQVEIANEAGGASGGVYDEARRAFMDPWWPEKGSKASKAFKDKKWNKYRIECKGSSIRTIVNGVVVTDFEDSLNDSGIIGLQVHDVGNDSTPYEVRWRNIRIMPLD